MAFASLTMDLNARLANIESDLGKMSHLAEKHNQRMQAAFAKTGQVAATALGALGVGSFAALIKGSIDAADNLNDLSKKTGVAVESLAGFDLVAKTSGTSLEDIASAVGRLNKSMGEAAGGNKEMAATLKAMGVSAKTPEEALYQIADAFGRFENEGDKARAMSQVLGKSWQSLAPALAEGGAGLRAIVEEGKRLNPVTREMAEQADKFNDAMSRFKTEAAGVGTSIATGILPSLTTLLEQLGEGTKIFGSFGSALYNIGVGISPLKDVTENLAKYRKEIADLEKFKASANNPDDSFIRDVDARLATARKKLEFVKFLQRQEALALNDQYGTGNYKQRSGPGPKQITLTPTGAAAKAGKVKDRMSDAEWAMEESAHLTRTLYQLGEQMDAAREAAFDRATESADAWQDSLDAANAKLRDAAAGYIDLIDPIEKYRRQLEEIAQLVEAGLLTQAQATEATFAIQQQIDAAAGFGEQLKETESIAKDLGLTFSSAFEDAIIGGKKFSDVLKGLEQDIARIIIRKSVTEPIGKAVSSIFDKGFGNGQNLLGDFASLFGFASGGSFRVGGNGGTDSQLVAFRATPGEMVDVRTPGQQSGGGNVQINQTIHIDSRSDQGSILQAMQSAKEAAKAEILASMQRGGTFARATGRA